MPVVIYRPRDGELGRSFIFSRTESLHTFDSFWRSRRPGEAKVLLLGTLDVDGDLGETYCENRCVLGGDDGKNSAVAYRRGPAPPALACEKVP